MQIKSFLKTKYSLNHSCEYFSISAPPKNTCPFIDSLRDELQNLKKTPASESSVVKLKALLSKLEDYRASCDSIRKEVIIAKTSLWSNLSGIFILSPENKLLDYNKEAELKFYSWVIEPYTQEETLQLDIIHSEFKEDLNLVSSFPQLDILLDEKIPLIKNNILKLDSWRSEYIDLINKRKEYIITNIKKDVF